MGNSALQPGARDSSVVGLTGKVIAKNGKVDASASSEGLANGSMARTVVAPASLRQNR
jgi:hypothetical protein